jgi:hypothetical protein
MVTLERCLRRAALLALAVFIVGVPPGAQARLGACPGQPVSQVFLPWADPSWYASVPDGGLEAGGTGWTLQGGATIVNGNEPYFVRSASDTRALAVGPSGSAASAPECIGPGHPTVRFFVRSENAANTALIVTVELTDPAGGSRSVPIGVITPTPAWQPSPVLPVLTNALALLGPQRAVFRFTSRGAGDWYVDDVYVDPYGKG